MFHKSDELDVSKNLLRKKNKFFKTMFLKMVFNSAVFMNKSFEYNLIHPWLKTGLLTRSE